MKIDGGATIWARQTIDSEIFYNKPDKWFKIWFYLVAKANHTDNKRFKKGSCFLKYDWIMNATGANKNEVDHCIRWLKSATMIATQKATRGFTVNVLKYPDFQNLQNYKSDTKSDDNGEVKAKQKRNKSDTINKNVKNDKNIKHIVEFLNSTLNSSFRWQTLKTQSLINARLNEKRTIEDFELVIEYKKKDWENTEQKKYLRPKTLFTESNFEDYLNQARNNKQQLKEIIA